MNLPGDIDSMYYEDAILTIMDMGYDQETAEWIWHEVNRATNFPIKKEC